MRAYRGDQHAEQGIQPTESLWVGNRQGIIATCESALICSQHYDRKAGFALRLYWILF